jgi:hypothetical protein
MAHARENLRLVLFDPLTRSAPVAELPAVQLALNKFLIDWQAGRQSGDPRHQRLSVRLSGSNKSQHFLRSPGQRRIASVTKDSTERTGARKATHHAPIARVLLVEEW